MLAELAAGHAIAAAAFVRVIGFDRTQDRTQLLYAGCRFVSKLTGDRFGKGTPQNRRRFEFDARAAGPGHGIQPHHILAPHASGPISRGTGSIAAIARRR